MTLEAGPEFEQLLEYLRQNRGFDFTGYKRNTLVRRVGKRAQVAGLDSFADYLDYLQVHPGEFPILFNTILIKVTEFFRDKPAWDYLEKTVIPRIVRKGEDSPIRVWSAACASGEEAYSAAMLLCEAMGTERYVQQVKVYATDLDEEAMATGRLGYEPQAMTKVPGHLVKKYFDLHAGRYVFKPALRRTIVFGRHDLLQDAPISRVDLLICRNVLIYFTAESQARILDRFHYALRDDGFLFLGRAEMLLTHQDLFAPLELRHRVFMKVPRGAIRDRLLLLGDIVAGSDESLGDKLRLQLVARDRLPFAEVVVDPEQVLVAANQVARDLFRLGPQDIGKPLKDLELSYRPVDLLSRVAAATRERKASIVEGVELNTGVGLTRLFDAYVIPLVDDKGAILGTSAVFRDTTEERQLRMELDRVRQEVETANEELQSSYEELETTNEELQSTVEELETTNEELQSSNEELETMNEELESTNSELQNVNTDMRSRTEQVDRLNSLLEGILTSLHVAVAVLDTNLRVMLWNARSHDLWGIRDDEAVGRDFFGLDMGLPLDQVQALVQAVVGGEQPQTVEDLRAIDRRGRHIVCRVSVTALPGSAGAAEGVVVVMEELASGDPAG